MVSVIIPAYNSEDSLSEAIDSVKNQSFSDWELILVNDGSTDSTASVCESFSHSDYRIRTEHKSHQGTYKARLEGVKAANGEWIMFLDADDILQSDALEALRAFDNGRRDIIAGNIVLDNTIVRANNPFGDLTPRTYLNAILDSSVYVGICSKLIRRDIFTPVFALNHPSLEVNEDVLMLVSMLSYTRQIYVSNSITCYVYRGFDDNVKSRKMNLDNWYKLFDALEPVVVEIGDRETQRLFVQYEILSLFLFPLRINGDNIPNDSHLKKIVSAAKNVIIDDQCRKMLSDIKSPARQRARRLLFRFTETVKRLMKSTLINMSLLSKEWLIKRIYS